MKAPVERHTADTRAKDVNLEAQMYRQQRSKRPPREKKTGRTRGHGERIIDKFANSHAMVHDSQAKTVLSERAGQHLRANNQNTILENSSTVFVRSGIVLRRHCLV